MFRTQQLSRIVLRSVLTQLDLTAESHAGAVYIGLGDRFDDDRRLVRETASTLRAGDTSRLSWSLCILRA
jgi:hypothetical protein